MGWMSFGLWEFSLVPTGKDGHHPTQALTAQPAGHMPDDPKRSKGREEMGLLDLYSPVSKGVVQRLTLRKVSSSPRTKSRLEW